MHGPFQTRTCCIGRLPSFPDTAVTDDTNKRKRCIRVAPSFLEAIVGRWSRALCRFSRTSVPKLTISAGTRLDTRFHALQQEPENQTLTETVLFHFMQVFSLH
jgi:hypothetical protein